MSKKEMKYERFYSYANETLVRDKVEQMHEYIQHGNTSCMKHCMAVAYYSLMVVDVLGIKCDRESLVRGALLHDYFLYDWHHSDKSHRFHGFRHNRTAMVNAIRDFNINKKEQNIILRHMFPLVPIPPTCVEGHIVCIVDKVCSLYEVFGRHTYEELVQFRYCMTA